MSAAIGLSPSRSSADNLFRKGGDYWTPLQDLVFELHKILPGLIPQSELAATINAAPRVVWFLLRKLRQDELTPLITDQVISAETGVSERNVQRVLYALDVALGKLGIAIIRRIRSHGRRLIEFIRGVAAKGSTPSVSVPPAPPIKTSEKTSETTTTREPSSSPDSDGEKTGEGREIASPELIDRACNLIPEATPGKVADAVAVYGADWVSRALGIVEKRNAKSGKLPVKSWGFVLRILGEWKRLDGPPPPKPTAPPIPARAKVEPPKEETPYRLTAEEVAELVRRCQSSRPSDIPAMAGVQLRQALAEGGIPAELVATIPAELVNPPKPRAP